MYHTQRIACDRSLAQRRLALVLHCYPRALHGAGAALGARGGPLLVAASGRHPRRGVREVYVDVHVECIEAYGGQLDDVTVHALRGGRQAGDGRGGL